MSTTHTTTDERADLLAVVRSILSSIVENIPAEAAHRPAKPESLLRTAISAGESAYRPRVLYRVVKPLTARMRLSESQRGVYQWVHMHPNTPANAIRAALKLTEGQTWAAIRVLERAKLLQTIPADGYGRTIPAPKGQTKRVNGTVSRRPPAKAALPPVDDDILRVLTTDMFKGMTQAEATKTLLEAVKRPVRTTTLLTAFSLGGLTVTGRHATSNLHKTLRKREDVELVKGEGWQIRV